MLKLSGLCRRMLTLPVTYYTATHRTRNALLYGQTSVAHVPHTFRFIRDIWNKSLCCVRVCTTIGHWMKSKNRRLYVYYEQCAKETKVFRVQQMCKRIPWGKCPIRTKTTGYYTHYPRHIVYIYMCVATRFTCPSYHFFKRVRGDRGCCGQHRKG
jgi:hypothetical protein